MREGFLEEGFVVIEREGRVGVGKGFLGFGIF